MTTVVLIVILIVLLILACTFGLIKKSKKKERRDPFTDVMTTLATDPNLINLNSAMAAYSQSPYIDYNTTVGQMGYPVATNYVDSAGAAIDGRALYQQEIAARDANVIHSYNEYMSGGGGVGVGSGGGGGGMMPHSLPPTGITYAGPFAPYPPGDPRWLTVPPGMERSIMGSAEAEFQNDFIEVFPMRHLEPKPDLT